MLENKAMFKQNTQKKKERGGPGVRSPPGGVIPPSLSELQNILPLLPGRQEVLLELLIEIRRPIPPGFNS